MVYQPILEEVHGLHSDSAAALQPLPELGDLMLKPPVQALLLRKPLVAVQAQKVFLLGEMGLGIVQQLPQQFRLYRLRLALPQCGV